MITLITATGGRPEGFALCEKYMKRQTLWSKGSHKIQWIVIDDCTPKTECTLGQDYYRGPKVWKPGINTQRLNLDFAIDKVRGDFIFVIEDDDWYHENYLEMMVDLLKHAPVVGEAGAKYYSIGSAAYRDMGNNHTASLCSTAFRREMLPLFEEAVNSGEIYIDLTLWHMVVNRHIQSILTMPSKNYCIGLKGLPGRSGIGVGHRPEGFVMDSKNYGTLREYIGDDTELYKKYLPKL